MKSKSRTKKTTRIDKELAKYAPWRRQIRHEADEYYARLIGATLPVIKEVTTRTPHKCEFCGRPIKPGSRAQVETITTKTKYGDFFKSKYWHPNHYSNKIKAKVGKL